MAQSYIQGIVVDEEAHSLPLVSVVLLSRSDSTLIIGTVTDSIGKYVLQLPEKTEESYLLKYSLVGYDSQFNIFSISDTSLFKRNIILYPSAIKLKEVIITAPKDIFKMTREGLLVNVEHSILQNEPQPIDLLSKIPGIILQGNKIEVFGKGTPVYYINNRKVQDFSEVERLLVKDIQSVCLVTSPGAKYDSDGRSVILIKVKRARDGIMLQANIGGIEAGRFNHNESLNLNYKTDKLNLFASYKYNDYGFKKEDNGLQTIMADTIWHDRFHSEEHAYTHAHSYQTGFDYDLSAQNSFGAKYTGTRTLSNSTTYKTSDIIANNIPFAYLSSYSPSTNSNQNHHLNIYYSGYWKDRWKLNVYADYIHQYNLQKKAVYESDSDFGNKDFYSNGKSEWDVYAMNTALFYDAGKIGSFSVGTNFSWVNGVNGITNVHALTNGKTKSKEEKHAIYFSYDRAIGDFSLNAGIRYESLTSTSKDLFNSSNSIKKTYYNLFPSTTLLYEKGDLSQTLSYSLRTERPDFNSVNNNAYYAGRFNYYKGNIYLKPSMIHEINYSMFYKIFYMNIYYTHIKNNIMDIYYSDSKNSSVVIGYQDNFKHYQELTGVVNIRYPIKWWEPSFSLLCMKSFFEYSTAEGIRHAKTPLINILWNNYFRLPKGFLISVNLTHRFKGDYQMINSYSSSTVNVSIQKYFLKNSLQVTLQGFDIFNGERTKYNSYFNNISIFSYNIKDSRKVGISIIHRFNHYSKKYKGENAADEEMKRLKVED